MRHGRHSRGRLRSLGCKHTGQEPSERRAESAWHHCAESPEGRGPRSRNCEMRSRPSAAARGHSDISPTGHGRPGDASRFPREWRRPALPSKGNDRLAGVRSSQAAAWLKAIPRIDCSVGVRRVSSGRDRAPQLQLQRFGAEAESLAILRPGIDPARFPPGGPVGIHCTFH